MKKTRDLEGTRKKLESIRTAENTAKDSIKRFEKELKIARSDFNRYNSMRKKLERELKLIPDRINADRRAIEKKANNVEQTIEQSRDWVKNNLDEAMSIMESQAENENSKAA